MSALASPLAGVGDSGDPFGGFTTFGFSIPQGNPGGLEEAASGCQTQSMGLSARCESIQEGARVAVGSWQGEAQAAFVGYAGHASSVLDANAEAFAKAGRALEQLAGELSRAQKLTRQAAQDCQTAQQQATAAQQQAAQHTQDAENLSQQAALAAHPHAQAQLNEQARTASENALAAQGEANRARAQFESAQKQGRAADHAYQQQAEQITAQIKAATGEIRTIPRLPGGAPIPIDITPADINLARRMLHGAGNLTNAAKAATNPSELRRLAGGILTPAAAAAFLRTLQKAQHDAPKPQEGNLLDAAGGLINTLTFGAISFGNPNTARYRGGELAGMIPIDPDALVVDVDKGVTKLAEDVGKDAAEGGATPTLSDAELKDLPGHRRNSRPWWSHGCRASDGQASG